MAAPPKTAASVNAAQQNGINNVIKSTLPFLTAKLRALLSAPQRQEFDRTAPQLAYDMYLQTLDPTKVTNTVNGGRTHHTRLVEAGLFSPSTLCPQPPVNPLPPPNLPAPDIVPYVHAPPLTDPPGLNLPAPVDAVHSVSVTPIALPQALTQVQAYQGRKLKGDAAPRKTPSKKNKPDQLKGAGPSANTRSRGGSEETLAEL
ncbi:hypothetical protein BCR33DRAFT_724895 [Rhizoclosmatium globosum]|uniref:Uncharacterized protein n=1 Tax=Rhizoclosmatium globosum TaxID=329046 RepID=A0A1Y2B274_9FUNG|nr:hypothetical protein BCR33DRAFT_724895 [Rhizoclosmatium globosum]|eukprot:ORY28938.1 hypothetical protein BCR33DRAFT_724895 [Rhizoclosmatium globosum]